jgi:tRNA-dihydrouridine synthase B
MRNFWEKLESPILALAPMAGVTDKAFRQICKEQGADVIYTEFASVDALIHGNQRTRDMISFTNEERPVVVQIFGNDPEKIGKACKIVEELGFDGVDINFGCPAYKVVKNGGGVACMRDLDLLHDIVQASCEAVDIPVSIKIRASIKKKASDLEKKSDRSFEYNSPLIAEEGVGGGGRDDTPPQSSPSQREEVVITAVDLMEAIKELPVAAVMIHARSYEKPFDGEADNEIIKAIRPLVKGKLIANGGVHTPEDAEKLMEGSGADGVGLARGVWGSPWLFKMTKDYLTNGSYNEPAWADKIKIILRHAELALEAKGEYGIIEMRKHFSHYIRGFPGASAVRQKLVRVSTLKDIKSILDSSF